VPSTTLRLTAAAAGDELVTRLAALPADLGIERQFPPAALAEADRAAQHPELPDRDLTEIPFATIDPAGSRDLDQAFHLERDGGGFRLFYAIADLSSFVPHDGPLDDEAHRRGRTIYAPDRRIPLHPMTLSEDAASLLPEQLRPAFVWEFALDAAGHVTSTHVGRARIRSRRQLDYVPVQAAIDAGTADEALLLLREVGEARLVLERERGGASLNVPETLIEHEGGRYRLVRRTVLPVEKWNAQLSLLTGMAAARLMLDAGVGILRTMATADENEFEWFRRRTHALHHPWPEGQPYGEYLDRLDGTEARQLSILHAAASLFRSAGYTPFDGTPPAETIQAAVGAPYSHVTAPLRRLVDRYGLLVCEALSAGRRPDDQVLAALPALPNEMARANNLSGRLDHLALDAVEAAVLAPRIGETFDAVVLGIRKGVATIQLSDPAVVARCDGHTHSGASIRARLEQADVDTGMVRFSLA
jgi:exoribonuclease R